MKSNKNAICVVGATTALLLAAPAFSGCGSDEATMATPAADVCAMTNAVPGSVGIARFPYTVAVDGVLNDPAWSDPLVIWHPMGAASNYRTKFPTPPTSDADISGAWAMVADANNLYIGVRVKDDAVLPSAGAFLNDGVEFYLDAGNEKFGGMPMTAGVSPNWATPGYDCNDGQFGVSADGLHAAGASWTNPSIVDALITAKTTPDPAGGGYFVEASLPLNFPGCADRPGRIIMEEGTRIGFAVGLNDDDVVADPCATLTPAETCTANTVCKWKGGDSVCAEKESRQNEVFWSAAAVQSESAQPWSNASVFAEVHFCGPLATM